MLLAVVCFHNSFARSNNAAGSPSFAFVENKGQVADQYYHPRNDIQFKLAAGGMNIFIGNGQIHYQWSRSVDTTSTDVYRLDMTLEGANTRASVVTEQQQPGYEQYYLTQCPNGVKSYSFKKITYKNVYPNIDWVLYTNDNQLKYDFIVHPGGDASDIQLKYDGATSLNMNNGAVTITTPFGSITEEAPYSYDAETKSTINSKFILNKNNLSFNVSPYTGTLVIDPVVTIDWCTLYGGSSSETYSYLGSPCRVSTDIAANAIMAGSTKSTSNIATAGAHQVSLSAMNDAYVIKFNSAGIRQWATYYGGPKDDYFADAACDLSSNIYCTGGTLSSTAIATPGAYREQALFIYDAMLVKFDSNGNRLWGTYYGGHGEDLGTCVVCDQAGYVYMGGSTYSDSGIATPGAHQTVFPGLFTGFITKFSASGAMQWGTYYGGNDVDHIWDMDCSATGDIVVGGQTNSSTGIATPGAFKTYWSNTYGQHSDDGFIAKFSSTGQLLWGTYYGTCGTSFGSAIDRIYGVAFDATGNIFVTGATGSDSGIATPGALDTIRDYSISGYSNNGFLAKFNSSGTRIWGTYILLTGSDLACNISGDVFVLNGRDISGPGSGFGNNITKINASGTTIDTFRKTATAQAYGIVYNPVNGKLYSCGTVTGAPSGWITPGAHQTIYGGAGDAFLAAWQADSGLAVHNVKEHTAYIQLYPNPNTGSFTLKADFSKIQPGDNVVIEVVNLMGAVVHKESTKITNAQLNKDLKLDVPGGIYLLRLTNGEIITNVKFSVQK